MRYAFPATLEQDDPGITVTFEGLSGTTWGATREEALRQAKDMLVSALSIFVDDGTAIPIPPKANGRPIVTVTMLESAKLALHDAMIAAGISNVELGRRLDMDEKAIRRLRDPLYPSKIGAVEDALRLLGRRAVVEYEVV